MKITDFSEGKSVANEKTYNTLVGNLDHLSPEIYYNFRRGETNLKYNIFKNDVYGLGILFIEMLLLE